MLSRVLYSIVLVLALLTGATLIASMLVPGWSTRAGEGQEDTAGETGGFFQSGILSKLTLFPSLKFKKSIVAVMVENHTTAREHHEGLSDALMIEEYFVEGMISRFMVLYDMKNLPGLVGPVRSVRLYFLESIFPLSRTIFFAGGSPEALERIGSTNEFYGVNGLRHDNASLNKDGEGFHRDAEIPAPHNFFLGKKAMNAFLETVPSEFLHPTFWSPYQTGGTPSEARAETIFLNFYSRAHDIFYTYDQWSQTYERLNGATFSDARPRNVLLLEIPITAVGEHGRLTIPLEGKGRALLFRSGTVQEGFWRKSPGLPFTYEDASGKPLVFSGGQTWMTVLPHFDRVEWE